MDEKIRMRKFMGLGRVQMVRCRVPLLLSGCTHQVCVQGTGVCIPLGDDFVAVPAGDGC
jgi:hypothetical protein